MPSQFQDDKEWLLAGIFGWILLIIFYLTVSRPYDMGVERAKVAAQAKIAKCKGNYFYFDFGEDQKVECL